MNDPTLYRRSHVPVPASPLGSITLITGCMFSGKTSALLRHLETLEPNSFLVFKHMIDDRYAKDRVVSHTGRAVPAVRIASAEEIPTLLDEETSLVAIDEGHFFDETLVQVVQSLTRDGVDVAMTALDRDSWARPFLLIDKLRALADQLATADQVAGRSILLYATCARCGARADRTQRTRPIVDGQMVGGPESYEPRCATCWTEPVVMSVCE